MPYYYIYFICSLPMLQFGKRAPFAFDKFLQMCVGRISQKDIDLLKKISLGGKYADEDSKIAILEKWRQFDTALRNELARIRAQRLHTDPVKYLRPDGFTEPSIAYVAINAYRNPSILEAEKLLDQARWQMLDEAVVGHYFDREFLIVYALKLLILERWQRIGVADRSRMLEDALT